MTLYDIAKERFGQTYVDTILTALINEKPSEKRISLDMKELEPFLENYGLSVDLLRSKSRKNNVKEPRQVVTWYLHRMCKWSYKFTGRAFAQDHSTAIHSVTVVEECVPFAFNGDYRRIYSDLRLYCLENGLPWDVKLEII